MNPGIYFGALNEVVRQRELAVITQNLSNISTPGYKKERVAFSKYFFSVIECKKIDFSEGELKPTQNQFDVAISGANNVFFVVKSADGKEYYTRRGDFTLDKEGRLITGNGFLVQGKSGNITLKDSNFQINRSGEILINGQVVDKLRLVSLPTEKLLRYGKSMFYLKDKNTVPQNASGYKIFQGYLEISNVKPIEEVADMISCLRNYEICQKSIQSQDETTSRLINDVGIVRA